MPLLQFIPSCAILEEVVIWPIGQGRNRENTVDQPPLPTHTYKLTQGQSDLLAG